MTPSQEEVLRRYFAKDRLAEALGIELVEFSEGSALCRMPIRDVHMNGYNVVHGGAIFALADFAFAVASNSHGTIALAVNTDMSFVKAVLSGMLTATAKEMSISPKLSTYNILVTDDTGETVGVFHGMAYRKKELVADYVKATQ
jgi:acyl-CoA thioesterase